MLEVDPVRLPLANCHDSSFGTKKLKERDLIPMSEPCASMVNRICHAARLVAWMTVENRRPSLAPHWFGLPQMIENNSFGRLPRVVSNDRHSKCSDAKESSLWSPDRAAGERGAIALCIPLNRASDRATWLAIGRCSGLVASGIGRSNRHARDKQRHKGENNAT